MFSVMQLDPESLVEYEGLPEELLPCVRIGYRGFIEYKSKAGVSRLMNRIIKEIEADGKYCAGWFLSDDAGASDYAIFITVCDKEDKSVLGYVHYGFIDYKMTLDELLFGKVRGAFNAFTTKRRRD